MTCYACEQTDQHTIRKMGALAKAELRHSHMWGVVNSGNAVVHSIHEKKSEADAERRAHAWAYSVVRVIVIPEYEGLAL